MTDPELGSMTAAQLSSEIGRRLRDIAADPSVNEYTWTDGQGRIRKQTHYFMPGSHAVNGKVGVTYISYQGSQLLDRDQAEDYLRWLRHGHVGSHHRAPLRPSKKAQERSAYTVAYQLGYPVEYCDVYRSAHVPAGADTADATEVEEGDRVYWRGCWNLVKRRSDFDPPLPEDLQTAAARASDAVLRGDIEAAGRAGGELKRLADQLSAASLVGGGAIERGPEVVLALASGTRVRLQRDTVIAIRRGKK